MAEMLTVIVASAVLLLVVSGPTSAAYYFDYQECTWGDCWRNKACVTIYEHPEYEGWRQCYALQNDECVTLKDWWINGGSRVSSIYSHGTCVRIYDQRGCRGNCKEFSGWTRDNNNLAAVNFDDNTYSVKAC